MRPPDEFGISSQSRAVVGERLRTLRRSRGVTGEALAKKLGCDQSRISRIENGNLKPTLAFVREFSRVLGLTRSEKDNLITLTQMFLAEYDRWHLDMKGSLPDIQRRVASIEHRTHTLRCFEWFAIPGLLQTREYAFSLFNAIGGFSPQDIDAAVSARMKRTRILSDRKKRFFFVIAENALWTKMGSSNTMYEQLSHIHSLVESRQPNLSIRLLPKSAKLRILPSNSFYIHDHMLATVETVTQGLTVWKESEIRKYLEIFQSLQEEAADDAAFAKVLSSAQRKWRTMAKHEEGG